LKELAGFHQLQVQNIDNCTQVTDAGVLELRKSLPKTSVIH
jgi:hypothetical protein